MFSALGAKLCFGRNTCHHESKADHKYKEPDNHPIPFSLNLYLNLMLALTYATKHMESYVLGYFREIRLFLGYFYSRLTVSKN